MFPRCEDKTPYLPCAEMCFDMINGCKKTFKVFSVACTSLANKTLSYKPCYYEPVTCIDPLPLPLHGRIVDYGGNTAPETSKIGCIPFYKMPKSTFNMSCLYSGKWDTNKLTEANCSLFVPYVIALAVAIFIPIAIIIGIIIYKYRFELKLLAFKYFSCCLFFCWCCRKNRGVMKKYDAFIAYPKIKEHYVKESMYLPLKEGGNVIAVDFDNQDLNYGSDLYVQYPKVISQCSNFIALLDEDFLRSFWCKFELNEALICQLEEPSFEIIIVLRQNLQELLPMLPRWLKSYITIHRYIQHDSNDLVTYIRSKLPPPRGRDDPGRDDDDVALLIHHHVQVDEEEEDDEDTRATNLKFEQINQQLERQYSSNNQHHADNDDVLLGSDAIPGGDVNHAFGSHNNMSSHSTPPLTSDPTLAYNNADDVTVNRDDQIQLLSNN